MGTTAGADAVSGATGGVQKTDLGATEVVFDVTKWQGAYIKLQAHTNRVFYVFSLTQTNNVISDAEALDAAAPNAGAPDWIEAGTSEHEIVPTRDELGATSPSAAVYLHVKASASGTRFHARKAQK
jgi:hypothetical protein